MIVRGWHGGSSSDQHRLDERFSRLLSCFGGEFAPVRISCATKSYLCPLVSPRADDERRQVIVRLDLAAMLQL